MISALRLPSALPKFALALLITGSLSTPTSAQCKPCISMNFNKTLGGWYSSASNPVCIQVNSGSQARSICSVDLFMRGRLGAATLTISIYNANGPWTKNNKALASTQVAVSTTAQVYTARFKKPAIVPPKTIFWIVYSDATKVIWPVSSSGTTVTHRLKWQGNWYTVSKRPWGYRINCGTLPVTAAYTTYGSGCPTKLPPSLTSTGRPLLASSFSVDLANAKARSPALLLLGFSNTQWIPGIKLPLALGGLGAPGCSLLCSTEVMFPTATDASGNARVGLAIPNARSLLDLKFYNQYFVFDKKVNALGMAASNGGKATIGDQ